VDHKIFVDGWEICRKDDWPQLETDQGAHGDGRDCQGRKLVFFVCQEGRYEHEYEGGGNGGVPMQIVSEWQRVRNCLREDSQLLVQDCWFDRDTGCQLRPQLFLSEKLCALFSREPHLRQLPGAGQSIEWSIHLTVLLQSEGYRHQSKQTIYSGLLSGNQRERRGDATHQSPFRQKDSVQLRPKGISTVSETTSGYPFAAGYDP